MLLDCEVIVDIKKKSFISLFETKKKDIHKLKMGMLFSCHGKRPKEDYEKISIVKNSFLSCGGHRTFLEKFIRTVNLFETNNKKLRNKKKSKGD